MPTSIPASTLEKFTTFGDLLRFLRRRASLTQLELSIAVGYSDAQISRLEQNLRLPDIPTIEARFVSALGLESEPKAVARLLDLAANVRREDAPAFGMSPYKGLNYFDEADADLFAGREALTAKLTQQVLALTSSRSPDERRFLAIVGASGSGKSSLARAGLVPALRWNRASAAWLIRILTPTARPLESLATSLTSDAGSVAATAILMDDLARDPRSLLLFARRAMNAAGASHLLLVIDQFEELFALCRSEEERTGFIGNLLKAASEVDGWTTAVITLRADFYTHCAVYPALREALAQHQEFIGAMNNDELRCAVEEPARRGRWEFEPGLVDLLLHDVGHEPGALPLLSHALLETWQRRRGHTMTLSGYTSSGGVRGAIAETAEAVFTDQFTREQQAIARHVFLRLTELGDEIGTGDTRRRATFKELILKPEDSDGTRAVLKALADARLITLTEDAAEVAHEALIREWPTLRGWLEDNRESLRFHRHLTEASQEWLASNHEQDLLYRGARLTQACEWATMHADEMNALEHEFLAASVRLSEREVAEREAQRQRELEAAQKLAATEKVRAEEQTQSANRLRTRNRLITAIGAAALILAMLAGMFSLQSSRNAKQAQADFARAESLRLAAEASVIVSENGDAETATLLSIRGLQSAYSFQADASLEQSLTHLYNRQLFSGHRGWIYSVAFSPDGKYVLTGSQDGTARLWDAQNGWEIRQFIGHKGGISTVAFSPAGKFVLTGGNDETVRLWDAESGHELRVISSHTGGISSATFSPDGRYILTAGGDHTARMWDLETGREIRIFIGHTDFISDVAFSRDGKYVLTAGFDKTARIWEAASGDLIQTFTEDTPLGRLNSAAFSPDGKYVLIGSNDSTARLWDAQTGQVICTFIGHTGAVNAVNFSPDGKYVLTGSDDKTAVAWDAQTCQPVRQFVGHDGAVRSVAFSPDEQTVLTGSEDKTARLWAAPASAPLRTFVSAPTELKVLAYTSDGRWELVAPGVTAAAFSPDGAQVLTGSQDGSARLWEAGSGREIRVFTAGTKGINSVAFSPDGKYILTGGEDHMVRLWDAATGQELRTMDAGVSGVSGAAFSPDGRYLLTTSAAILVSLPNQSSGQTIIWDAGTGRQIRVLDVGPCMECVTYGGSSLPVAFSPDSKDILHGGFYSDAVLIDFTTGSQLCTFRGHLDLVLGAAFSPDGRYVVTGSADKTARLWDARTCKQLRLYTDNRSRIAAVAFSPDGKYILTGHEDNTAHLWDVATGQDLGQFIGHTGGVNSVAFSPDGRFVLTGSQDGTARLWDTDYHDTIRYACSLLWRDLTNAERTQYSISDEAPTCPKP